MADISYSVVIAAYRRPKLLLQTLATLMPQVGSDGEVIVVEQCPLVDLRSDLAGYSGLHHVVLGRPGAVEARNHGIRMSRGRIVIFVDDDVVVPAGFLHQHLAGYSDESVGGVAGKVVEATRPPCGVPDPRSLHPDRGWRYSNFDHDVEMDVPHAPTCNLSLRRDLIVQAGGFDPFFRLAWREDSDLCFRVRMSGARIRYIPKAWLTHLSAVEGGTRGDISARGYWSREWKMYKKCFVHYRDNIYFLLKHFHGTERCKWLLDAYWTYVGLSRWPWRYVAKNAAFALALVHASLAARVRRGHPCRLDD